VNIEYCLLEGVNDSDDHATALAKLLHGRRMHVNLIPYNPIGGEGGYRRPTAERLTSFGQVLLRNGIVAHIRRTRGDDVGAACGQLRALRDEVDSPT
jgi:23S rRNA (adenine2503-C2)-methyltransferase